MNKIFNKSCRGLPLPETLKRWRLLLLLGIAGMFLGGAAVLSACHKAQAEEATAPNGAACPGSAVQASPAMEDGSFVRTMAMNNVSFPTEPNQESDENGIALYPEYLVGGDGKFIWPNVKPASLPAQGSFSVVVDPSSTWYVVDWNLEAKYKPTLDAEWSGSSVSYRSGIDSGDISDPCSPVDFCIFEGSSAVGYYQVKATVTLVDGFGTENPTIIQKDAYYDYVCCRTSIVSEDALWYGATPLAYGSTTGPRSKITLGYEPADVLSFVDPRYVLALIPAYSTVYTGFHTNGSISDYHGEGDYGVNDLAIWDAATGGNSFGWEQMDPGDQTSPLLMTWGGSGNGPPANLYLNMSSSASDSKLIFGLINYRAVKKFYYQGYGLHDAVTGDDLPFFQDQLDLIVNGVPDERDIGSPPGNEENPGAKILLNGGYEKGAKDGNGNGIPDYEAEITKDSQVRADLDPGMRPLDIKWWKKRQVKLAGSVRIFGSGISGVNAQNNVVKGCVTIWRYDQKKAISETDTTLVPVWKPVLLDAGGETTVSLPGDVPDGVQPFYVEGVSGGEAEIHASLIVEGNPPLVNLSDWAKVTVGYIDLDMDNDNIDEDGDSHGYDLERSGIEDALEENCPARVPIACNDVNHNGGDDRNEQNSGQPRAPAVVELVTIGNQTPTVTFTVPPFIRLYRNGNQLISSGTPVQLAGRLESLTVEGLGLGADMITVSYDPDGSGPLAAVEDKVKVKTSRILYPPRCTFPCDSAIVDARECCDCGCKVCMNGKGSVVGCAKDSKMQKSTPFGTGFNIPLSHFGGGNHGILWGGVICTYNPLPGTNVFTSNDLRFVHGTQTRVRVSPGGHVAVVQLPDGDEVRFRFLETNGAETGTASDTHRLQKMKLTREADGTFRLYTPAGSYMEFSDAGEEEYGGRTCSASKIKTSDGHVLTPASAGWPQVARAEDGSIQSVAAGNDQVQVAPLPTGNPPGYQVGVYNDGGQTPAVLWKVKQPNPATTEEVEVSCENNAGSCSAEIYKYLYDSSAKLWSLIVGDGNDSRKTENVTQSTSSVTPPSVGDIPSRPRYGTSVIQNVKDAQGTLYSKVRKEYSSQPGVGTPLLLSETVDPDGVALTTEYTYEKYGSNVYNGEAVDCQRPTGASNPDGSWTKTGYDAKGRVAAEASPWLDGPAWTAAKDAPAATIGAQGRLVSYDYTPVDQQDVLPTDSDDRPRTVTESVQGTVVGKTWYVYKKNENGEFVDIVERAASANAGFGDAGNQRTVTVRHGENYPIERVRGLPSKSYGTDGNYVSYDYELGSYQVQGGDTQGTFTPSEEGGSLCTTATMLKMATPTSSAPLPPIAWQTVRKKIVADEDDNVVSEQNEIWQGDTAGWKSAGGVSRCRDPNGRPTQTSYSNGIQESQEWSCCYIISETSADGKQTTSSYNQHGEKIAVTRDGKTINIARDPTGTPHNVTVSAGGLSLSTSSTSDGAGRPHCVVAPNGVNTTIAYDTTQRLVTATRGDGAIASSTQWLDGRPKSLSGSGTSPACSEFGVNTDGTLWSKSWAGSATPGNGQYSETTNDFLGRPWKTKAAAPGGGVVETEIFYDSFGRPCKSVTTAGGVPRPAELIEYDGAGNVWRVGTDMNGNGVLDLASSDKIVETETAAVGDWMQTITRIYETANSAVPTQVSLRKQRIAGFSTGIVSEVQATDIHGQTTIETVAIGNGHVTKTTTVPGSDTPIVQVTEDGRIVSSTDRSGHTTNYAYDALGRLHSISDSRGNTTTIAYNDKNQVITSTDGAGNITTFAYDSDSGRQILSTNPLNGTSRLAYDLRGNVVRNWGSAVKPTEITYDDFNRRTSLKTFRGGTGWDGAEWPTGNAGDTTSWNYDSATGLLLSKTDANGKSVSYAYTPFRQLATLTRARNVSISYSYDAIGQMTLADHSDGTPDVVSTYDRIGRKVLVGDAVGTRAFSYDAYGQLAAESTTGLYAKALARTYDAFGRSASVSIAADSWSTGYTYDSKGRTSQVSGGAGAWTLAYMSNADLLSQVSGPYGISVAGAYETNRDLLTRRENKVGNTIISAFDLANDPLGRRTSIVRSGSMFPQNETLTFAYNSQSEVVSAASSLVQQNDWSHLFAYDSIGNRLSATKGQANPVTTSYTTGATNAYTAIQEGLNTAQPTYDDDGNMTAPGDGWEYEWDAENRLIRAEREVGENTTVVECQYDYMSRRVEKTVKVNSVVTKKLRFVYNGFQLVEELDALNGNALIRSYVWVDGKLGSVTDYTGQAPQIYCYLHDPCKNVSELVDANGIVVAHYEYDPFGRISASSGVYAQANPFRFSNEYWDDDLGLVYYNYRYYSPILGRWLSRDPIGEFGGENIYSFVYNRAYDRTDSLGLKTLREFVDGDDFTVNSISEIMFTNDELDEILESGGYSHWNENELSPDDRKIADKELWAFTEEARYKAYARILDVRRARTLIFFRIHNKSFEAYTKSLYKLIREINFVQYVAETGYSIGSGRDCVLQEDVSRIDKTKDLVIYLAIMKGIDLGLGSVKKYSLLARLEQTSPIKIPPNATRIIQVKNGYDQIRYTWSDGVYKYEARWHTRTPNAPEGQGNTWVITKTKPGTPMGQQKVETVMVGENQWVSKDLWDAAVQARKSGTATPEQQALLDSGHFPE